MKNMTRSTHPPSIDMHINRWMQDNQIYLYSILGPLALIAVVGAAIYILGGQKVACCKSQEGRDGGKNKTNYDNIKAANSKTANAKDVESGQMASEDNKDEQSCNRDASCDSEKSETASKQNNNSTKPKTTTHQSRASSSHRPKQPWK